MKRFIASVCIISVLIVIYQNSLMAQNCKTPFLHYNEFQRADSNKLFLRIENFNFLENNEYSNDYTNGTTWIGYLTTPKLVYYPSSKIRIETGIRLQKYFGRTNFTETEATFSVNYEIHDQINLILGSLNQDNNHQLSEPIFEPERFYTDKAENGIQLLYNSDRFNADTWINWEQFILDGDPFQEKFNFGISSVYQLTQTSAKNKLSIPFQVLVTHRGGEIDTSDEPTQTIGNFATGLNFLRKVENSRINSWQIKTLAYYFHDHSSNPEYSFSKGHAFYPQFCIDTKYSKFKLGYWYAYHFIAPKGSELFQSISYKYPGTYKNKRRFITLKWFYEREISKNIYLGGKLELDFNPKSSDINYTTALYFRINGNFFLKKVSWD